MSSLFFNVIEFELTALVLIILVVTAFILIRIQFLNFLSVSLQSFLFVNYDRTVYILGLVRVLGCILCSSVCKIICLFQNGHGHLLPSSLIV